MIKFYICTIINIIIINYCSLEKKDRGRGGWDELGGPTATSNPEPFSDFFDFFAIGDGEVRHLNLFLAS